MQTIDKPTVDLEGLRKAIQEEYALVAEEPEHGFHFFVGRPLARLLGYEEANGAVQAGHETQIVLANEAVDLMSGVVAENLMPFGWPPFKEILAETVSAGVRIHV